MSYDKMESLKHRFPVGTRVKVIASDLPEYVARTGVIADYDAGDACSAPLIGVVFDAPVELAREVVTRDGFYDDEILRLEDEAKYLAGKRITHFDEDRVTVLARVREIEESMDKICELAQKNPDIADLICRKYPGGWRSLDEVSLQVNEWRFAMQEDGLDE